MLNNPLLALKFNIILEQCKNKGEQCWPGMCCKDLECGVPFPPMSVASKGQTIQPRQLPMIGECKKIPKSKSIIVNTLSIGLRIMGESLMLNNPRLALKLSIILEQCKNEGDKCTAFPFPFPFLPGNCCKDLECRFSRRIPLASKGNISNGWPIYGKCQKRRTCKYVRINSFIVHL